MDWIKDLPPAVMVIGVLLAFALVYVLLRRIRRAVRRAIRNNPVSRAIRQTGEVVNMVKAADMTAQLTPKSVSGGDAIYLPRIMKDYPQFNADLAKSVVEDNIRKTYGAEHFADLKIHRTAISDYKKLYGTSTIKFQTAFQYTPDESKGGRRTTQEKAETEYTFKVKDKAGGTNAALRCGHCGAPVARLGDKSCTYCGNEVILDMEQAWEITDINIK